MRTVAAVIVGYLATAVSIMGTLGLAFGLLGASFAFRDDSLEVTFGWVAVNGFLSLLSAIFGGWLAARIGRGPRAVNALVVLMLAVGLAGAVAQGRAPAPEPPAKPVAELSMAEAAQLAQPPSWYPWVIPLVGACGVLIGGRIRLLAVSAREEGAQAEAAAP